MNDEFITVLFKNNNVKDIVITNNDDKYQISALGHTVENVDFLKALDEIYNIIRYDPVKITVASYMNFIASARINNHDTFLPFKQLISTIYPPSYDELLNLQIEFVKYPLFYANGIQYECVSRRYENGDKIDYSVYKWLYTMSYDSEGDCTIRGVLKDDI